MLLLTNGRVSQFGISLEAQDILPFPVAFVGLFAEHDSFAVHHTI